MSDAVIPSLPAPPDPAYVLRAATEADVMSILAMDRVHMRPAVERWYPGEWDEQNALGVLQDNLERARVVERNGEVVGCYYFWTEEPAIAVLHSVQVVPDHRGAGVGSWLISCFETEARRLGMKHAGLAVYKDNPALRLYERLGYRVSGTDGPGAWEMLKDLR
jgi:GNAT superfamily N-acetyltransferase